MRLFNRIVLVIVLVVLVVFGTFGAIYAFAGAATKTAVCLASWPFRRDAQAAQSWLSSFEDGSVPLLDFIVVVTVGVAGLALWYSSSNPAARNTLPWVPRRGSNAKW